jgi:hypothetical protein
MRMRCNRPSFPSYPKYGGRGITMDPRWEKFSNFFEDMGERPPGTSLDRIDGKGNYTKSNCRWADQETQTMNRARGVFHIVFQGKTKSLSRWCNELGLPRSTARKRHRRLGIPYDAVFEQLLAERQASH